MSKKIVATLVLIIMLIVLMVPIVNASIEGVILKEAENNVCTIELGEDGKVVKKLVEVSDENKDVTLQIDVTNLKNEEQQIAPSEIFLVLDNSDSMTRDTVNGVTRKDAVFTAAKSLAESILNAQNNAKIGVVRFSSYKGVDELDISLEGTLDGDAKLMLEPTNNITQIKNTIDSIVADGPRTDIDAGLQMANNNFSNEEGINKYIILLTDGVPNDSVGGPTITYSGETNTRTKATLQNIVDSGINIITVMTGVESNRKALGTESTFKELAEDIFGTQEKPNYGKFYYVTDDNVTKTITEDVFSDIVTIVKNEITNITLIDYFPEDILANYTFEIYEKENIGTVTPEVNIENGTIMWTIEKLEAGQTATFKYKLKLKEDFNKKIIDVVMPTNKKVDVNYIGTDEEEQTKTSDVSPKIVLKADDTTIPEEKIPQTGDISSYIALAVMIFATSVVITVYNYKK